MSKFSPLLIVIIGFIRCSPQPEPINPGTDTCDFCHMIITDKRFGGEIITKENHVFKFDDPFCIASYRVLRTDSTEVKSIFLINYALPHNFINSDKAIFIYSNEIPSPMGGNIAAFDKKDSAIIIMNKTGGIEITLDELFQSRSEN